jgi:hypothetical protein
MKKLIIIPALALLLVACGGQPSNYPPAPVPKIPDNIELVGSGNNGYIEIYRYRDEKYGVTCWVLYRTGPPAMTCIPDTQLKGR